MQYVVGIDGGGTKTEALAVDMQGNELVRLTGEAANPHAVTFEKAALHLCDLLERIAASRELAGGRCEAACLGLAGVDSETEKERIQRMVYDDCQSKGWRFPLIVCNDAEIGLAAALRQTFGMLAISGTGSIIYGMTPDGEKHRTGGWGHLLGDEGSGYHIGLCTLREVMHSYDGVRGPTQLTELVLAACGIPSVRDLKSYIYRPEVQKKEIASFAESCLRAAERGDEAAVRIVRQAAVDLSAQACALIRKHEFYRTAPLGMSGSIFRHCALFRETFAKQIAREHQGVTVALSERDPVWGAAELAAAAVAKQS